MHLCREWAGRIAREYFTQVGVAFFGWVWPGVQLLLWCGCGQCCYCSQLVLLCVVVPYIAKYVYNYTLYVLGSLPPPPPPPLSTSDRGEKARELPVVFPDFDRETCNIPNTQVNFSSYLLHQSIFSSLIIFRQNSLISSSVDCLSHGTVSHHLTLYTSHNTVLEICIRSRVPRAANV